ncbi:MAG: aminoglycoside phosphotransferase family protein [Burkholderiales bacterium]
MTSSHTEHHVLTKVGEGGSAEIYTLGEDRVVKLFKRAVSEAIVARELRHTRLAHALGIPCPHAIDMVRVGGRLGIAFERFAGATLLDHALKGTEQVALLAAEFCSIQEAIHRCDSSGLPPFKAAVETKIGAASSVAEGAKRLAVEALRMLPDGDAFCHSDFHPRNVVMSADGPKVLDWLDASRGDPAADVARTLLLIDHAVPGAVDAASRRAFRDACTRHWQTVWPDADARIGRWRFPLAVARLAEAVDADERHALLETIEQAAHAPHPTHE